MPHPAPPPPPRPAWPLMRMRRRPARRPQHAAAACAQGLDMDSFAQAAASYPGVKSMLGREKLGDMEAKHTIGKWLAKGTRRLRKVACGNHHLAAACLTWHPAHPRTRTVPGCWACQRAAPRHAPLGGWRAGAGQSASHPPPRAPPPPGRFGLPKNDEAAAERFMAAAEAGHPPAMYRLGKAYAVNRGVERDLDKAVRAIGSAEQAAGQTPQPLRCTSCGHPGSSACGATAQIARPLHPAPPCSRPEAVEPAPVQARLAPAGGRAP